MFREHTVIVIGAGAGVEYNMPLGSKLVSGIASSVNFKFDRAYGLDPSQGSASLFSALRRRCEDDRPKLQKYISAGKSLAAVLSSSVSIDDALYHLGDTPEAVALGKACIISAILEAEGQSTIKTDGNLGRPRDDAGFDGWVQQIFSMAISGLKQNNIDFAFDNITFVNFNYDRCLEHYIYWSLQRIGIKQPRAAEIIRSLKVIRPYGGIGSILTDGMDFVPYGGQIDLFKSIARIRTYTESDAIHDGSELERCIEASRLVVFLGFGFHKQNMDLLKIKQRAFRRVMATVKFVHAGNKPEISADISTKIACEDQQRVELFDMTAPEMLRELRPKIMMAVG